MDYTTLTDEELAAEKVALDLEVVSRRDRALIPKQMDDLAKQLLAANGIELNDPWIQPQGGHDAYPLGWTVTHGAKVWESLLSGNVWEPGVSGWREVVPVDQTPEWVAPTGAHDAYKVGDVVIFEGMKYKSLIDANAWSPVDFPQGWEMLPYDPPVEPTP